MDVINVKQKKKIIFKRNFTSQGHFINFVFFFRIRTSLWGSTEIATIVRDETSAIKRIENYAKFPKQ